MNAHLEIARKIEATYMTVDNLPTECDDGYGSPKIEAEQSAISMSDALVAQVGHAEARRLRNIAWREINNNG